MELFIRSLLIVMIMESQAELNVASYGNQKKVCCELDTSSKIDELESLVKNYLTMVNIELRNTNGQVKELKVTMTDNRETVSSELDDTRRVVEELQVAVSGNQETVSSELEDTRRKMDELQETVSGDQETVSSELGDTRRKVDELQVAVSTNQQVVTSEIRNTRRQVEELQVTVSGNQEMFTSDVQGLRRQLEELQTSVFGLVELIRDTSPMNEARTAEPTERTATTEADTSHMNKARTADATERTATTERVALPKDCSEIHARGVSMSGVYTVHPLDSGEAFQVYCDMETDGGGWTVFQRRQDGSVDFYLDFANYSRGFGNLEGEFWLGNDILHRLTAQGEYELRVDMSDFETESRYAAYDSFSIADVSDNYRLTLGSYSGTAGDSLSFHNIYQFSTKDRDNDQYSENCAELYNGAWWYGPFCHHSNLNGLYLRGAMFAEVLGEGVIWYHWKGHQYSLKTSEMKIRPTPQ